MQKRIRYLFSSGLEGIFNWGIRKQSSFLPGLWLGNYSYFAYNHYCNCKLALPVFPFVIYLLPAFVNFQPSFTQVSDAWDTVETKATEYYWESRITFLHEIQLSMFESKRQSRVKQIIVEFGNGIAEWVDDFGHVGLFQEREKFSWTRDSPYNQVADVQQYFKPQDYFHPDIAKVIKQARSLDADMYWISQKEEGWERRKKTTIAAMKWVGYYAIYLCLVVLGFVTGGFFWPTGLRRAILSYGYNSADGRQRDVGASKVQANESTEKRIEHNLMIPKKTSTRMFEDFFIEIMGVNPEVAQKIDSPSKLQLIADKIGVKLKRDCNGGCD